MINNSSTRGWDRLAAKQLDQQFVRHIIAGLNCSPFEAEAVLEAVHQIYALLFDCSPALRPGQILLPVVSVEAPPGPRLVDSRQTLVLLTLEDLNEDLQVRRTGGVLALRRHRLVRVCHEALQQGGLLTLEDLAYRLFNCGQRTLSHRRLIVEQWLEGKEYSDIARATCHSVASVQNYVEKFKRVALLAQHKLDLETLAFLAHLSKPLAQDYLRLLRKGQATQHRRQELHEPAKKKSCPNPTPTRL